MSDQIKIQNLEVYARHGVYPEETKLGQKFLVDATLFVDTRKAGFSDELHDSVDYGRVCRFVTEFMKTHTYKLLEAVAEQLSQAILLELESVRQIDLEIKKPWAPIALPLDTVSVSISRKWHRVYVALGSNLGDRVGFLKFALNRLANLTGVRNLKVSSLIETAPYGVTDQPPFVNGVVVLDVLYTPYELLEVLHEIEAEAGRERKLHWGPRTLDLDILFYDDEVLENSDLIVPHADMANRMFVLAPLAELCPGKVHPVLHKTILQLKRELEAFDRNGK